MSRINKRTFKPRSKFINIPRSSIKTVVDHWTWTRDCGVMVTLLDGYTWKSEYTLPELLAEEKPIETTGK